jgi:2-oxoglutarate dehydrogenase E2 component (dihydrolipoamide succinyltransferase)
MPIEIKMPQLGESITTGIVSRWFKKVGDRVERYETLFEVETDKVNTEVPAPAAGILQEILVTEGQEVPVGTVLALIAAEVTVPVLAPVEPQPAVQETQPAPVPARNKGRRKGEPHLTPVVARMVAEHNLDLRQIAGTGLGGRVSKQDVLRFLKQQAAAAQPVRPAPTEIVEHVPISSPTPASIPETLPEDADLTPLTGMRRAIAGHMVRSVSTIPHVTTVFEIDMSRVVAHREQNRAAFERQGVRLTYTAYFFQAAVAALRAIPVLNGRYSDEGIITYRHIHIGMAVALDEGLIVPVIRDADEKNLLGLARAINDLAERTRARKLRPDETQGGTFTITNHGINGSLFSTPIIHYPQSGILGVGAIVKRPVVITHEGLDMITIKPMCYTSLTFDHRLLDGATGDAFMMVVKNTLEQYA